MAWPAGMPLVTITQDVHKLPNGALPSSYAVHLRLSVPALVFDGQTTLIRRSITLTAEDPDPEPEWPQWVQPVPGSGTNEPYAKDAKVTHKDQRWTSDLDGNVWEPGVYGWTLAP